MTKTLPPPSALPTLCRGDGKTHRHLLRAFSHHFTTTLNDIEHLESQSYNGVSVARVFLQPNAKVELAVAQITALSQSILRPLPPGTFPPSIAILRSLWAHKFAPPRGERGRSAVYT